MKKTTAKSDEFSPQQTPEYARLNALGERMPSALLFYGANLAYMHQLAHCWANALLCENPLIDGSRCKKCSSCHLIDNNTHPDFYTLNLDDDDKQKSISVAAVRAMTDFLSMSSHRGGRKIVLIPDTDLLNLNSANALLKILEEPTQSSLFILLSNNVGRVLPTILSRVHKFKIAAPSITDADITIIPELSAEHLEQLLQIVSYPSTINIFSNLTLLNNKTVSFTILIEFLLKWLHDLVLYKLQGEAKYFAQYSERFTPLINKLELAKAFYLHDRLAFLANWSTHPLNYKLQTENLLLQYQQLFVKS